MLMTVKSVCVCVCVRMCRSELMEQDRSFRLADKVSLLFLLLISLQDM